MNKAPDRAKMRRQYLRKKAQADGQKIIGIAVISGCSILAVLLFVGLLLGVGHYRFIHDGNDVITINLLGQVTLGLMIYMGHRTWKSGVDHGNRLAFVPSVREQIPSLPAEEVLLRSSEPYLGAPPELLRPAVTQETPAEQLLRASVGE